MGPAKDPHKHWRCNMRKVIVWEQYRNSVTGLLTTNEYGEKNPRTTEKETFRRKIGPKAPRGKRK